LKPQFLILRKDVFVTKGRQFVKEILLSVLILF